MRGLYVLLVIASASATPALGQVQSRPTDRPLVTAANESWYVAAEPIQFAGDLYYPAGATVFFNGNTMVRSGHYNGVPLYTDTTIEPYSIVYVPIESGLMRPYERPRQGRLAGTVASRTPSFPVRITASTEVWPQAAAAPTELPTPIGAISVYTPAQSSIPLAPVVASIAPALPSAAAPRGAEPALTFATLGRPSSNDGVWIQYLGEKWISAGPAVPITPESFRVVGRYEGFPVFVRNEGSERVIFVPTRGGLAAPYRLKQ